MDYSEFKLLDTKKTQIERARIRAIRESNCTSVTRTGQRTPPTVCCWTSPSPSPSRGYSLANDPSGLRRMIVGEPGVALAARMDHLLGSNLG